MKKTTKYGTILEERAAARNDRGAGQRGVLGSAAGFVLALGVFGCSVGEGDEDVRFVHQDLSTTDSDVNKGDKSDVQVAVDPSASQGLSVEESARAKAWLSARYNPSAVVRSEFTASGIPFDCVDANEQPGLRRAKIRRALGRKVSDNDLASEKRGFEIPQEAVDYGKQLRAEIAKESSLEDEETASLESVDCPVGTVPVRKIGLGDIAAVGSLDAYLNREPRSSAGFDPPADTTHEYAKYDSYADNQGGDAHFNLWSPYTRTASEFSLSQMWIVRGSGTSKQTIESGWQDYKDRTGTWQPHLFIFSTQDGYDTTGCYDDTCGDWVQSSSSVSPGMKWTVYSSEGSTQYKFRSQWWRGAGTGNWYLYYDGSLMGYYPGDLYDSAGLGNKAARVSFGGEITDKASGEHTSTDMGSGNWPSQGHGYAAYIRTMQYKADSTGTWTDVASTASSFVTDDDCYDASLNWGGSTWRRYIYFGGAGKNSSCP